MLIDLKFKKEKKHPAAAFHKDASTGVDLLMANLATGAFATCWHVVPRMSRDNIFVLDCVPAAKTLETRALGSENTVASMLDFIQVSTL